MSTDLVFRAPSTVSRTRAVQAKYMRAVALAIGGFFVYGVAHNGTARFMFDSVSARDAAINEIARHVGRECVATDEEWKADSDGRKAWSNNRPYAFS